MSFELSSMQWAIPTVAVVLSLVLALDFVRRRRALERVGNMAMIALMANSLSTKRRALRAVILVVAITLCLVALGRPTTPGKKSTWKQRGIDVVFVYDYSRSMLATDVYPNRLARSIKESEVLLAGLVADRVATVVFAGGAVHFPLTHNHVAAQLLYKGLLPSDLAPGSDLGQAIRMATCVLMADTAMPELCEVLMPGKGGDPLQGEASTMSAESPLVTERARAIVIFSDGGDSEGFAQQEAELAERLGIELFVVGVGTAGGELIPKLDGEGNAVGFQKDKRGAFVTTTLDSDMLRATSAQANGAYFSLGEGRWRSDLLLAALKDLKRGDLDKRVIRGRNHIFVRFLFPAFLLLLIEACFSERRRRTLLPVSGGADE